MRCCLISAPTVTEFRSRDELGSREVQEAALEPQLGILSLAAVLEGRGEPPALFDVNGAYMREAARCGGAPGEDFVEVLAADIARAHADIYGFSSICSTYPLTVRLARELKRLQPWAMVLFGGPQASVVDVPTLEAFPWVDFVLRGEAERTLPQLLDELAGDLHFEKVAALTFRDGGLISRNANAPVIEDLDALPSVAYHLSDYLERSPRASIELGRGCPFACTFCSTNDFFRRRFRLRSPERVLRDMHAIADRYGIRSFDLVHDMFTVDRKRVEAFCRAMIADGSGFRWACSARTDCVDEALLEQMAAAGCNGVFFGIETGSERMQRVIDKHLDTGRAREMIAIADRLGMKTTASLIVGFPEEQPEDVEDTVGMFLHAARYPRCGPQVNLLAPLAGTPIHEQHRETMVLDELCSDMSHQGLGQGAAELALIREHPAIFPNFYLLPLEALDREALFDLKEFLGVMVEHLRWLLVAIDAAEPITRFHAAWRQHRLGLGTPGKGVAVRAYYLGQQFRRDLLRFLKWHPAAGSRAVQVLAQVEESLHRAQVNARPVTEESSFTQAVPARVQCGCATEILEFEGGLEDLVMSLRERRAWSVDGAPHFYATRGARAGVSLVKISPRMATLLASCVSPVPTAELERRTFAELPPGAERRGRFERLVASALESGLLQRASAPRARRRRLPAREREDDLRPVCG